VENFRLQQQPRAGTSQNFQTSPQNFHSTFSTDFKDFTSPIKEIDVNDIIHRSDSEEKPLKIRKLVKKIKKQPEPEDLDPDVDSSLKIGGLMKKYQIFLSKKNLRMLADTPPGIKSDSLFVARTMTCLFTKQEIERGTITGNLSRNPNYVPWTELAILDPHKISFLKKVFRDL
jgi:hypothetical protein